MIEKRTVFILGAGASCPYGFPTSGELRTEIIANFKGAYSTFLQRQRKRGIDPVDNGYPNEKTVKQFIDFFNRSSNGSIDLFLSRHPAFETVGKMAICLSILQREAGSCFCFKGRVKYPDKDWYFYLFDRLSRELTGEHGYRDFSKNNTAFITFNYDRSLEHFLFESLLHSFQGADAQGIREQIERIPIIHVYGRPAPLLWQRQHDYAGFLEYGHPDTSGGPDLLQMTRNLFVIHEERTSPLLDKAREEITRAERIFFLGFGYAKENLETLAFPGVLKPGHYIYGTAIGFNAEEIEDKKRYFVRELTHSGVSSSLAGHQVKIDNCDCVQLLRKFL